MPRNVSGQHSFAQIPSANIQRSTFDRSCGLKTTFNAGDLVPIFVDEALPGDTMQMKASAFGRMATLLHPVMENMSLDFFFFAIPLRLLWNDFKKFMGEQANPGDSTDFTVPQMSSPIAGWGEHSLGDYFGIPTKVPTLGHSSLPFRAYNLTWNEWFRDENLQSSAIVNKGAGPDSDPEGTYPLRKRGKRHDYFSSSLPWPQKGIAVPLPLGDFAPVIADLANPTPTYTIMGGAAGAHYPVVGTSAEYMGMAPVPGIGDAGKTYVWGDPGLVADLTAATGATINALREAFQVQRLFERDARGGTRYTEILRSHFGVVSDDARLQRPEYLGGGSARINVNTVASTNFQTTPGDEVALGELGAYATVSGRGIGFSKSFTEHCIVLGLVAARADLNYQQGLERMWSRLGRFDFYWPALAHLGEQPVYMKEIFATGVPGSGAGGDDVVFGYQERYAEYRFKPSRITGRFRSNSTTTLDSWHLAQDFATAPLLNAQFIEEDPPIDRIVAVSEQLEPPFLLDMWFQFKHTRPMPVFGVPGLIDHF